MCSSRYQNALRPRARLKAKPLPELNLGNSSRTHSGGTSGALLPGTRQKPVDSRKHAYNCRNARRHRRLHCARDYRHRLQPLREAQRRRRLRLAICNSQSRHGLVPGLRESWLGHALRPPSAHPLLSRGALRTFENIIFGPFSHEH